MDAPPTEDAAASERLPDPSVVPAAATSELVETPVLQLPTTTAPSLAGSTGEPAPAIRRRPSAPLRRWIDDTGRNATVGRLVAVTGETVAIRKANGRVVRVPLDRLSDHDRAYVASVDPEAEPAGTSPATRDTVGL